MKFLFALFCSSMVASAGTAEQSDWSGGPLVQGPTSEWNCCFEESSGISWLAVSGLLCLSSVPLGEPAESGVNNSIPLAGLAVSDVDCDGDCDIIGASRTNGPAIWFENTGTDSWELNQLEGAFSGMLGVSTLDVNMDGYQDVIGATMSPDMVVVWFNQNGSGPEGTPEIVDASFPGVHFAVGGLMDDDELVDIIGAANECNQIAVWYKTATDWEKKVIDGGFTGTQSVDTGDFDGDGDLDAAGAAFTLGEIAWFENPGTRTDPWQKHTVQGGFAGAHHVLAVDIDHDGSMDILGTSYSGGKICWWENSGDPEPAWEQHIIAPSLVGALSALAADFDGDGDLDVAGTSWSLDRIRWFENTGGQGESWSGHDISMYFNGAWPLSAIDSDGNGRLEIAAGADVLSGSGPSHGLSLYDLCEFGQSGTLTSSVLDTYESPQWAAFEWDIEVPASTSLQAFWRSSNDPSDLGDWMGPFTGPCELSGSIGRYVQYKLAMESATSSKSPVITDISLAWDPQYVTPENGEPLLISLLGANPSPGGSIEILAYPPDGCELRVTLYDTAGRTIASTLAGRGKCTFSTEGLASGVYLVRAVSDGRTTALSFVVL